MRPYLFRRDGWPKCPECGEDELAILDLDDPTRAPTPSDVLTHRMFCYRCARYTVAAGEGIIA